MYIYIAILLYYTTSTNDSSPGIFGRFLYTRTTFPCSVPSSAESEPPCFLEQKIHASNRSSPALECMTYATQAEVVAGALLKVEMVSSGTGGGGSLRHENHLSWLSCVYTHIHKDSTWKSFTDIFYIREQWPLRVANSKYSQAYVSFPKLQGPFLLSNERRETETFLVTTLRWKSC